MFGGEHVADECAKNIKYISKLLKRLLNKKIYKKNKIKNIRSEDQNWGKLYIIYF